MRFGYKAVLLLTVLAVVPRGVGAEPKNEWESKVTPGSSLEAPPAGAYEKVFAEAQRLRAQGTAEAKQAALREYRRALHILRQQGTLAKQIEVLSQIGELSVELTDFQTALGALTQALIICEQVGNRKNRGSVLTALANTHQLLGHMRTALDYYRDSLLFSRESSDFSQEAGALMGMGFLYDQIGQPQEALHHLAIALDRFRRLKDPRGEAYARTGLSTVYIHLADYENARKTAQGAVPLLRNLGDRRVEATALSNVGVAFSNLGQLREAVAVQHKALEQAHIAGDRLGEALILNNLGRSHQRLNDPEGALKFFKQALSIQRETEDHHGEANVLYNLGAITLLTGKVSEAEKYFKESLQLSRKLDLRLVEADNLVGLARIERQRKRLSTSRAKIEDALAIVESVRSEVTSSELRTAFFSSVYNYYAFYIDLLMQLDQLDPRHGLSHEALLASERARARSLLDLLQVAHGPLSTGENPGSRKRRQEHLEGINSLQRQLLIAYSAPEPDPETVRRLETEIEKAQSGWREVELESWKQESPRQQLEASRPLTLEGTQKLLDQETALLEYAFGEEASYLFAVTDKSFVAVRLPPASKFAGSVTTLRQALSSPRQTTQSAYLREACNLYQTLIAPVEAVLRGKSKLIIVPDGILYELPFGALLTSESVASLTREPPNRWPFLILHHAVSYAPSATLLAALQRRKDGRPSETLLAFGDPVYTKAATASVRSAFGVNTPWRVGRLPHSRREIENIAALFDRSKVEIFLGPRATEENVKRYSPLRNHRYLHFAVHGIFNERRPEYSGLILSLPGTPAGTDDGIVQAYEILGLDLAADLVVLSACETGLGRRVSGEGVIGLSRAFLQAGATSLLVSLWRVSDRSTPELMVRFYRKRLHGGLSKSEALWQAQLQLVREGRFAHPYHWAAFNLVGDP